MTKKTLIKIVVSIVLFAFLFSKIDLHIVLANMKQLNVVYLPILFVLIVANYLVSSYRWKKLLLFEEHNVTTWFLSKLYFIGAFFNNFMPTSMGGDVYKIYRLGKKLNNNSLGFAATFMERFTGFVALILISYFGFFRTADFWFSYLPVPVRSNAFLMLVFEFFAVFGFWLAIFAFFIILRVFSTKVAKVKKLYEIFVQYKRNYKVLGITFSTSFLVQLLSIMTQYLVCIALGIQLDLFTAFFIFPIVTLAAFFIPSLNGLGVQDALYIQFFSTLGVPSELALSASIIYHLLRLSVSLIGGVLYAIDKE